MNNNIPSPMRAEYLRHSDKPGYAQGVLTVYAGENLPCEYRAFWGNANGKLESYTALAPIICTGEVTEFELAPYTLIPRGADRLLVFGATQRGKELSDGYAEVMLPQGASDYDLGKPMYEMQVQSDIHLSQNPEHSHNRHFAAVLEDIKKTSPNTLGLFINGDITNHGYVTEYDACMEIIDSTPSAPPVYFAMGNHDLSTYDDLPCDVATANFLKGTRNTWSDKAYFDLWISGVHFIFLASERARQRAWLSPQQLAWLDAKLAENRNAHRAKYVFLHQGMVDTVAGCLAYQKWHDVEQTAELTEVLGKYPEAVLFSGHSHWKLECPHTMKPRDEKLPTIFNTSAGGYTWDDTSMTTQTGYDESEGYYFYGYEDKVLALGRDFLNGKWIASAQFIIEY